MSNGKGIDWYAKSSKSARTHTRDHIWPHDGGYGTSATLAATHQDDGGKLGIALRVLENDMSVEHGISAVRTIFPLCEFNTEPIPF